MRTSLTATVHGATYDDVMRRSRQVLSEFFSITDEERVDELINRSECELQISAVSPIESDDAHAFTGQLYIRIKP